MAESWINYDDDEESEPKSKWRHSDLKAYWRNQHAKRYETFGAWGIKEAALLSKLLTQYEATDLADMMDYWFETSAQAHLFGAFYKEAVPTFEKVRQDRDGWEW